MKEIKIKYKEIKNFIMVREEEKKNNPYNSTWSFFRFIFSFCLFQITNQNHFPTSRLEEEVSYWIIS